MCKKINESNEYKKCRECESKSNSRCDFFPTEKCEKKRKTKCEKKKYDSKCKSNSLTDCIKLSHVNEKCHRCKHLSKRFCIDYHCTHKFKDPWIDDRCKPHKKHNKKECKCNDNRCRSKSKSRSECDSDCDSDCEEKTVCDLKINNIDQRIKVRCEAVSLICESEALIIPSSLFNTDGSVANEPVIYDYKLKKTIGAVTVFTNNIQIHRITDATDVDEDGCFWLLDVNCQACRQSNGSLIKAWFDKCKRTIEFIAQYQIPLTNCECNNECPNFEGLAKVGKNDFILFSNDKSEFNGHGIVFVTIKCNEVLAKTIHLKICDREMNPHTYDLYRISTAFAVENGVIFVPQFPEQHIGTVFMVTNRELHKVKHEIHHVDSCKPKCISMNGYIMTLCMKDECKNTPVTHEDVDFSTFMTYRGIKAMTVDRCGKIYGITSWVYPYLILSSENPVPMPPKEMRQMYGSEPVCIQTITDPAFPAGYDRSLAGFYTKPFVGKLITEQC